MGSFWETVNCGVWQSRRLREPIYTQIRTLLLVNNYAYLVRCTFEDIVLFFKTLLGWNYPPGTDHSLWWREKSCPSDGDCVGPCLCGTITGYYKIIEVWVDGKGRLKSSRIRTPHPSRTLFSLHPHRFNKTPVVTLHI